MGDDGGVGAEGDQLSLVGGDGDVASSSLLGIEHDAGGEAGRQVPFLELADSAEVGPRIGNEVVAAVEPLGGLGDGDCATGVAGTLPLERPSNRAGGGVDGDGGLVAGGDQQASVGEEHLVV